MPAVSHSCVKARRLDIRLRQNSGGSGEVLKNRGPHVHMLNSTLAATQRTMSCLLENHQTPEGVSIPEALRPYMGGVGFIPFKNLNKISTVMRKIAK